jgi:two-component system, OmpR family, response regulator QseB
VRILLVEDDDLLAAGIRDTLERALYAVEWVADGVQALAALQANAFDLVILDLGLPRLDGIEVLKRVRVEGATTPVIVLSARDTANDRVIGLDAGADDYLVKPFDVDELLARVPNSAACAGPRATSSSTGRCGWTRRRCRSPSTALQ